MCTPSWASFLGQLSHPDTVIALEATQNWYWLAELLESSSYEVLLSCPRQTRAIIEAAVRTAKIDAVMLARHLLTIAALKNVQNHCFDPPLF